MSHTSFRPGLRLGSGSSSRDLSIWTENSNPLSRADCPSSPDRDWPSPGARFSSDTLRELGGFRVRACRRFSRGRDCRPGAFAGSATPDCRYEELELNLALLLQHADALGGGGQRILELSLAMGGGDYAARAAVEVAPAGHHRQPQFVHDPGLA